MGTRTTKRKEGGRAADEFIKFKDMKRDHKHLTGEKMDEDLNLKDEASIVIFIIFYHIFYVRPDVG